MFKRFRSNIGDIHISNTSGHSATIGKEFVNIHESLWRMAYMEGAIAEDVVAVTKSYIAEKKEEMKLEEDKERSEIKELMRKTIVNDPLNFVDKNNQIIYRKAVALVKKTHKKEYFESIWAEIVKEDC
jgi:hypothetical protein